MQIETTVVDIETLIPDPNNERKHDEKNLKAIRNSLKQFGQVEPLIVRRSNNVVIGGNGRLEAMKAIGLTEAVIHYVDFDELKSKALRVALNRTSELASWDEAMLGTTLQELREHDVDLDELGFDISSLEDIGMGDKTEGLTDPDNVHEVAQNEMGVVLGDIYQLGSHRLMCGDSTSKENVEKLMNGEKADMVFTDPPYGVGYKYNSHDDNVTKEQHFSFLKKLADTSLELANKFIITPGCNNLASMSQARSDFSHVGCWTKTNAMSPGRVTHFWTWEPIFFYGKFKRKRGNDVFNYPVGKQPDTGDHTCPKPIAFWIDIVDNFSDPKDKILDFFLGSGSTLIACEKTGRKCYGMELDPHYCSVIIKRWQDFTGKTAVKL